MTVKSTRALWRRPGSYLKPDISKRYFAAFAVVLQRDETFSTSHLLVLIGHMGEDHAVDFLCQSVSFSNDLHGVPRMVAESLFE
jgi:hypothetical protein